ncbi:MAG: hypothetical protein Q9208_005047, partial [Pyrenodesmia sp. 3 TL-2023]
MGSEHASASLRRGHSDGDVLGPQFRALGSSRRTQEDTWMDFLRESSRPIDHAEIESRRRAIHALRAQDPAQRQERQAVMQRAALMLADRKRRFTETQEDHARRRSASSLPSGPALTAQRTGFTSTTRPEPSFAGMEAYPRRADHSVSERTLPRPRPSDVSSSRRRRSREITLPRWQPDSEVTSCPICGTRFGLFFRKHHCRKCGRVVCANCSPHRITIPRQFIVQPSQEVDQGTEEPATAGIEVVDITDDPGTDVQDVPQGSRILDSPQSPILRIDPALGGGQEPQLREEDECPICHLALPPKGPDGSEIARETHVTECIEEHFSTSTPRTNRPHPSAATNAVNSANAAGTNPSQAAGGNQGSSGDNRRSSESVANSHSNDNGSQRMGSQRRRIGGMVTYHATEKDCMDEGGEPAECVICFEEFEQGIEMGRLECLCKFHK